MLGALALAAAALLAAALLSPTPVPERPGATVAVLAAFVLLAGVLQSRSADGLAYSTAHTFLIAGVLLVPPYVWALLMAPWVGVALWYGRNRLLEEALGVAGLILAALAAHAVLVAGGWTDAALGSDTQSLLIVAAGSAFLAVYRLVSVAGALFVRSEAPAAVMREERDRVLTDALLLSCGVAMALLLRVSPFLGLIAAGPLLLVHRALYVPVLKLKASRDPKTGLWNADYFESRLAAEMARARRRQGTLSVIMADLDLLRNINNSHGHLTGDRVIRMVADAVRSEVRSGDVAARLGGEEFAVLLPECGSDHALEVAQRIRSRIEGATVWGERGERIEGVTVSAGVATFPDHASARNALLHAADLAAYRAKSRGRNTVCVALPEGSAGATEQEFSASVAAVVSPDKGRGETAAAKRPAIGMVNALLVGLVIAAGAALASSAIVIDAPASVPWAPLALVGLLALGAEAFSIGLYGTTRVSISAVLMIAAAVAFGPLGAVVAGAGSGLGTFRPGKAWYQVAFNCSTYAVAGLAVAGAASLIEGLPLTRAAQMALVASAAPLVFYVANIGVVTLVVSRVAGERPLAFFREKYLWLFPHFVAFGVLGYLVAEAYQIHGLFGIAVFALPPAMMRFAMKQYVARTERDVRELRAKHRELEAAHHELEALNRSVHSLYRETVGSLVAALDARDSETEGHSERVAVYALRVAKTLGIKQGTDDWDAIERGSLLHDVGKIGVPDYILRKPGRLTSYEWEEMKRHSEYGWKMLRNASFLQTAAELVYCHHERFDGSGYPRGLAGEQIPLGARIFAVVDAYDAMTSGRPYRKAISPAEAIAELERCAGTQFDPRVVAAFKKSIGVPPGHRDTEKAAEGYPVVDGLPAPVPTQS